jgi:hypothetical protein
MKPELGPLKVLVEREVLEVGTEITTTAPLMDKDPDKILIETPLTITFDLYVLFIFNQWTFNSQVSKKIQELKGQRVKDILAVDQTLELRFYSADTIRTDMSDDGFLGPEALVLHGPDNLIVVWN